MNKQEMIDYCKKHNITKFSNKSKNELKEHIHKYELLKKHFHNIRNFRLIQQIELENERKMMEEQEKQKQKQNGFTSEYLGDDLERIQLEQAIEISLLETKHITNDDTTNEINDETVDDTFNDLFNPRSSKEEINALLEQIRKDFPCSTIDYSTHEHPYKDENYKRHKEYIYENFKSLGDKGEKLLFHGTDKNYVQNILEDDFSLTNQSRHGNRFGKGIYFTDDINLACNYSERDCNQKYLILCKVHVGNLRKGDGSGLIKKPDDNEHYDTIVDDISNPKQYVKVKNGTYSIQGVITITINDTENSTLMGRSHYSSRFSSNSKSSNRYSRMKTKQLNSQPISQSQAVSGGLNKQKPIKKLTSSVKFINMKNKKVEIYYKPDGIDIYDCDINDLKMMNILTRENDVSSFYTKMDDIFVCVHKGDIIRIVTIQNDKEIIEIN